MRKKYLQRVIGAMLMSSMLVGTLVGCGQSGEVAETSSESSEVVEGSAGSDSMYNEPGTYPICKEKQKLTIGMTTFANILDIDTNALTLYIEEQANVDLEFILYPAGQEGNTKIGNLINTGSELPDIIIAPLNDTCHVYGMNGAFAPLSEYIENPDICYNLNQRLEAEPEFADYLKYAKSPDGEFYAMPMMIFDDTNVFASKGYINKTWLDNLGLEVPTTTDELMTALKAIKENDCNGNGALDEMGLASNPTWSGSVPSWIMNAFVYCNPDNGYVYDDNGEVKMSFMQDEFRDGLAYMNELCSFGGLDPMCFTMDGAQYKTLVRAAETEVIAGFVGNRTNYDTEDPRKEHYAVMPPLVGPDGFQSSTVLNANLPRFENFITSDCENPELAARVLDLFYSEKVTVWNRYGELGVSAIDHKGEEGYLWANTAAEPKYLAESLPEAKWGTVQNVHWTNRGPCLLSHNVVQEIWDGNTTDPTQQSWVIGIVQEGANIYKQYAPENPIIKFSMTEEESASTAETIINIKTYVEQEMAAFITGSKELNDDTWNEFLKYVDNLGAQELLAVYQAAHDRMK